MKNKETNKSVKPARNLKNDLYKMQEALGSVSFNDRFSGGYFGTGFELGTQINQTATLALNNRNYFLSNDRVTLTGMYRTHAFLRRHIDSSVDDMFRGGLEIKSDELDHDDIKKIHKYVSKTRVLDIFKDGVRWCDLYGGAGIIINTAGEPSDPLIISQIKQGDPLEFYAADLWELFWQTGLGWNNFEKPYFPQENIDNLYNFYGIPLNSSRVIRLQGLESPSWQRNVLRGWGESVFEPLVSVINKWVKHDNLLFEILDEAKIDRWGIKDLNKSLSQPEIFKEIVANIQATNQAKNYLNAVVNDADDVWESKTMSFAGIAETKQQIRLDLAAGLGKPMSKIFGLSATGFNSGEEDIENYNSIIENKRDRHANGLLKMYEIICQDLFGFIPDLEISFKPLRVLSAEQLENVKNHQFNRIMQLANTGYLKEESVIEKLNAADLIPGGITLDDLGIVNTKEEITKSETKFMNIRKK